MRALTNYYKTTIKDGSSILDICSSWCGVRLTCSACVLSSTLQGSGHLSFWWPSTAERATAGACPGPPRQANAEGRIGR